MSKIVDYKAQVKALYHNIADLTNEVQLSWGGEEEVAQKIEQETPTLMFYGVYNAGKSTLLNAIIGEEVASMADVPETHRVTAYPWNGYELYDTPGINGPEKDYVLSRAELIKHNIILFLVDDSDSFDSKIVSEEIVAIIESGKPLILVMNNKQTIDGEQDADGIAKRGKLYANIDTIAKARGILNVLDRFKFIMIDADTALRARLQNKQVLLKASALEDLEQLVLQTMKSQEGFQFLMPPVLMMEQQLVSIKNVLSQQLESNDEAQIVRLIDDLRDRRMALLERIKSKVRGKLEVTKDLVLHKLMNEQSIDEDTKRLNDELHQMIQHEVASTMEYIQVDISKFAANVSMKNPVLAGASLDVINVRKDFEQQMQEKTNNTTAEVVQTVMQNQIIAKGAEKVLAKTILPKIIATPIPVVNIVLIAKTVYDVISILNKEKKERERLEAQVAAANAQQEEALYNRQQAIQQLKSQLDVEFYRMHDEIIASVDESIKHSFADYVSSLENDLHTTESEMTKLHKQLNKTTLLQEQLNLLKVQLVL